VAEPADVCWPDVAKDNCDIKQAILEACREGCRGLKVPAMSLLPALEMTGRRGSWARDCVKSLNQRAGHPRRSGANTS